MAIKIDIDKELFESQIKEGMTIPQLQKFWNCSRTTITLYKKKWDLIGISPNSKKRDNGDGTKICNCCKQFKSINEFYSNGFFNGKPKIKGTCIKCENSNRNLIFYNKIKKILKYQNREYKCELCGYDKNHAALVFHHYTGIKNFEISKSKTTSEEKLSKEIELCKLLCQNCHHEIHNPTLMIHYGDA